MSEKQPYKDDLSKKLSGLPLPDENLAWQKMEAMLDEDKRRRGVIPFFFKYGIWILALLIAASGVWYLAGERNKDVAKKEIKENEISTADGTKDVNKKVGDVTLNETETAEIKNNEVNQPGLIDKRLVKGRTIGSSIQNEPGISVNSPVKDAPVNSMKATDEMAIPGTSKKGPITVQKEQNSNTIPDAENIQDRTLQPANTASGNVIGEASVTGAAVAMDDRDAITNKNQIVAVQQVDSATKLLATAEVGDSLKIPAISIVEPDSSNITLSPKPIIKIPNRFVLSAGIGEQQQIPVAGQSTVKYNDNGSSNILKDYIPSVYVQLQKGKWFLNASFKYAGAQYVTKNSFYQQTRYESASKTTIQNSSSIEKIYYHQLPVSLNYDVLPNLSVGVGGMFNWLHSTIIQNKTLTTDATTNNLISENLQVRSVKSFTDSFFYATPFSAFIQTEYKLNRLSLGLRYSHGVQPFMKYTMPDGSVNTQYSQSLQFILRFRLWQSPLKK